MQRDLDEHSRLLCVYWRTHNKLVLTPTGRTMGRSSPSDFFLILQTDHMIREVKLFILAPSSDPTLLQYSIITVYRDKRSHTTIRIK